MGPTHMLTIPDGDSGTLRKFERIHKDLGVGRQDIRA
jgi:hypothetical protein